ncbi:MAG: penicillin-binding protein 1A [Vicinamibacterales bacterium]
MNDRVPSWLRGAVERGRRLAIRATDATAGFYRGRPLLSAVTSLMAAVGLCGAGAYGVWFTSDVAFGLPDRTAIRSVGDLAQATTLYDINGRVVFTIFREQRIEVPLKQVSPHLVRAVLAIEDQRFYDHGGIDVIRVAAAALANLRSGRRAQGGSTITQQLARQSFLNRDKTFRRKLKEVVLAAQIERAFSKDEILETYLNKVYFGDGFYGVEAAALGYFNRHASEVTVSQAALLAGLIQSPSSYAPTGNRPRALNRRNVVLAAMRDARVIDEAVYRQSRGEDVILESGLHRDEPFGLYFKEVVRLDLISRFGWERVSAGGLKVYTTMDGTLQPRIESLVEDALTGIESRRGYRHKARQSLLPLAADTTPDYLQGAVVVMDAATGEIRALVGGRNFKESRFNRAVQARRQAGSAFKPFVYAAALEQGLSPASVVSGLDDPMLTAQGEWVPEDEHGSGDSMTLRTALRTSSNRAAVQVLRTVGIARAVDYVRQFDLGEIPRVPSLVLGSGEVTLASMTAAYAAFANAGQVHKPVFIRRVEDADGQVLYRSDNPGHQAVNPRAAFLMANMLTDVINHGTAWKARSLGFTLPAAGKTGTTNDYRDVWFVGFTPKVVAGVWMGFDRPKTIVANGYAGELAVPLWSRVMQAATQRDRAEWLKPPEGIAAVRVCRLSGKLPAEGCSAVEVSRDDGTTHVQSMVYTEYFAEGTSPAEICDLHRPKTWFRQVADFIGGDTHVHAADIGPPPPAGQAVSQPAASASEAKPSVVTAEAARPREGDAPKKRGFWSRLFGRRDKPTDDPKDTGRGAAEETRDNKDSK